MISIEQTQTYGWEAAIRGMRNPMNSWDKSDSKFCDYYGVNEWCDGWMIKYDNTHACSFYDEGRCCEDMISEFMYTHVGENDLNLMERLTKAGTDHRKFMRMITVYCDITAPLYWWKEFDTYKVGTVANSCSTMHKIQAKEFELDDFSHEHMFPESLKRLEDTISTLEFCRYVYTHWEEHRDTKLPEGIKTKKDLWWQMIQLLPSSYNQKRTVMMNYEILANIYKSRKNHKLDEWRTFCDWIKTLSYSELITGEEN